MKKQITYPDFIARLFATMIDLLLLSILILPVTSFFSRILFIYHFDSVFTELQISPHDPEAVMQAVNKAEFANHITFSGMFNYLLALGIINFVLAGIYFVTFWVMFGSSPGKMVLRMKIVQTDTINKPTFIACIVRFMACITAIPGLLFMFFTPKKQALHDKISGTNIIKC